MPKANVQVVANFLRLVDTVTIDKAQHSARDQIAATVGPEGATVNYQWQYLKNGVWNDIPNAVSDTYTVEEDYSGYEIRAKVEGIGDYTGSVVSNKSDPRVPHLDPIGNLIISKMVAGNAADSTKGFTFVVTFDSKESYSYTGNKSGTIRSGDSIVLAHGQSITILGLPVGTSYTVTETEANKDGYTTTAAGATGKITDGTVTAAFTNSKSNTTPTNPEKPEPPTKPQDSNIPKSGDSSSTFFWLTLIALSGAGLFLVAFSYKRWRNK